MAIPKPVRSDARRRRRYKVTLATGPSFTIDISSGGFSTESMRVLPAGAPVIGTIQIEGRELAFQGRVAWSRAGAPAINERGRMGISFTAVPQELLAAIKH